MVLLSPVYRARVYIPSLGSEVLLTLVAADLHNDAASKTIEVSLSAAKVRCRPNLASHHVLGFFKLITSVSQIALALYSRRFVPVKYTNRKSGPFVIFNGHQIPVIHCKQKFRKLKTCKLLKSQVIFLEFSFVEI